MIYRTIKEPALSASFSINDVEALARTLGKQSTVEAGHKILRARSNSFAGRGRHAKKAARKASAKRRKC